MIASIDIRTLLICHDDDYNCHDGKLICHDDKLICHDYIFLS